MLVTGYDCYLINTNYNCLILFIRMCDPRLESHSWTRGRVGPPCPRFLSLHNNSKGGIDDFAKLVGMGSLPLISLLYKAPFLIDC